jgi:DNA-binding protein Fis
MLVDEALSRSKNNQSIAAGMLGLTRSALNKRINKQVD